MLFGYFLHDAKSDNSFSLQRTSRFSKPRFSSPQWRLRTNKIKSFAALSPPTWSPCSRPFAILPVSAVSDAQKLATGNFLHVRAASLGGYAAFLCCLRRPFPTFCKVQKVGQSCCSDVQKVAGGKFLCVGDRRNRENCERT